MKKIKLSKSQTEFGEWLNSLPQARPASHILSWNGGSGTQRFEISTTFVITRRCTQHKKCPHTHENRYSIRALWMNGTFAYAQFGHEGTSRMSMAGLRRRVEKELDDGV